MKKLSLIIAFFAAQTAIIASAQAATYISANVGVPVVASPVAVPVQQQSYCREYTQTLKIADHIQKAYGTACLQPDGSWQLMPKTAQAPNITYIMRNDSLYYMPPQPLFGIVLGGYGHEDRRHEDRRDERRDEPRDR